ncbi:MAG: transketolase [Solirubrobacteraceae bacterium]|nr:transketolase [Solirubrobacteraceae bacterium]
MTSETDQLCVDTIRTLSMDAIQKANSGHPGLPMAMAPAAFVLFRRIMSHDPSDPQWPDRDRFLLSAGHGSMLLYSVLHLTGYDLPMDEIKQFRQWGSRTAGHPERDRETITPGVEVTTGPLGQGFANGVGMAMAEQYLRERYGDDVQDHHTFAIVSDGDLMEGIASEAASLAGQLGLGRMVYLYDDNDISLDGPTSLSFDRENVSMRFEAYGWQVLELDDPNDLDAIENAIREGMANEDQPTLIRVKSIIGYPSPNKQGSSAAHGAALGDEEVALTKKVLGWDPDKTFFVPDGVYDAFDMKGPGGEAHAAWSERFDGWRADNAQLAAEWDCAWARPGRPLAGMADALPASFDKDKIATRGVGGKVMAAFEPFTPTMLGGAADLTESTKTIFPESDRFTAEKAGRNIFFGVREHAMGAAVNGLAGHGGIVCPYGSTFLQFADYMRGAIRLSALMGLHVAWVYTHDSVALGEDGPTHQPVEHLAALRAIPGLVVIRPADAFETTEAWRVILEELEGPAVLVLSRQDLPVLDQEQYGSAAGLARGAYVLADADDAQATILATGSEVSVALAAADELDVAVRVVSMPSWELFEEQDDDYQESVLPLDLPAVSVEAGVRQGWERYADSIVSIDRFGASAPGATVLEELGITPSHVAQRVRELLD